MAARCPMSRILPTTFRVSLRARKEKAVDHISEKHHFQVGLHTVAVGVPCSAFASISSTANILLEDE